MPTTHTNQPTRPYTAVLTRELELGDRTLGLLRLYDRAGAVALKLYTLEFPWVDKNRDGISDARVSRIPLAQYDVRPHSGNRFKNVWRFTDPPGRSAILIHGGSYPRHTLGCILAGLDRRDIDGDGKEDVGRSRAAIDALRSVVGRDLWQLTVIDAGAEPTIEETPAAVEALRYVEPEPPDELQFDGEPSQPFTTLAEALSARIKTIFGR